MRKILVYFLIVVSTLNNIASTPAYQKSTTSRGAQGVAKNVVFKEKQSVILIIIIVVILHFSTRAPFICKHFHCEQAPFYWEAVNRLLYSQHSPFIIVDVSKQPSIIIICVSPVFPCPGSVIAISAVTSNWLKSSQILQKHQQQSPLRHYWLRDDQSRSSIFNDQDDDDDDDDATMKRQNRIDNDAKMVDLSSPDFKNLMALVRNVRAKMKKGYRPSVHLG
uniref:Uncharacterized protein n=1 Tax=Romanomermis culicivorax TaxID=13658 RepID=A0A915KLY1_ROMCU